MSISALPADRDTAHRRAWSQANRVTFAVAMLAWSIMIVFHFAARTGWGAVAVLVPTIGLIWHGTYLRFKRQARRVEQTGERHPGTRMEQP
ncbi:MAG: hypothetical protein P8181_10385 [bacterium]